VPRAGSGIAVLLLAGLAGAVLAAEPARLRLATTTSTENSGLLSVLNPRFEARFGAAVDVIAVGSGKALKLGENGDVDLLLVHSPQAEAEFVAAGFGVERRAVMHNDFVVVGPPEDPAGVRGAPDAAEALRRIADRAAPFVSRGDESGTHVMERSIWRAAGIEPGGRWYLSTGQAMGAVLLIAGDERGYTLSDRGTFLAFRAKTELAIVFEGDPMLVNPYHVIAINPKRHPHVRFDLAMKYIDFVTGPEGQRLIAGFEVNGHPLFVPDAVAQPGSQ
jgi:tungstate transport system substrate-binding protein